MHAEELKSDKGLILSGPLLLSPTVFSDQRGCFFESWNKSSWDKILITYDQEPMSFVQDNHSKSTKGILRGLHYQKNPYAQAKLVRVVVGEVFDVAVDIRTKSKTFGQWVGVHLSDINNRQLWIPEGFAHGFLVLSDKAEVLYRTTSFWSKDAEVSIRWNDPKLAISWPDCGQEIQLSEKDKLSITLEKIPLDQLF